jgi:hypothetical protein
MKIDRNKVLAKYNGHCAYCGKEITVKEMQVDHIQAKRYNGTDDFNNLNPSCRRCNHYKRASGLESFRWLMKTIHTRIEADYITKVAIDYGIITVLPFDGIFYFEKFNK